MDKATVRALARELMRIQQGSVEDAKNLLLDSHLFSLQEEEDIAEAIDQIAQEMEEDLAE